MINQILIEAAIKNKYDLVTLKKSLKLNSDDEVIDALFKYIKMTSRNYFRTNNMKISEILNPACDYICAFSGTHELLIAEKYKILNAYITTLQSKSKDGTEKCRRVKSILRRIVKYDINCVDLNDFEEIRDFSINNDLNQNDKDDKHIINILIMRMFDYYSGSNGKHIHMAEFLEEIVKQHELYIDDKNMREIEVIIANMLKQGPKNRYIKKIKTIIQDQKNKQILQRLVIDGNEFDSIVSEENLEDLYNRTYSTTYCMLETKGMAEEECKVLYKFVLILDKIIDRVFIKLKRVATDLDALMKLRINDNNEFLDEVYSLIEIMIERVTQSRIEKRSREAKTKLLAEYDIPHQYEEDVISRIIIPKVNADGIQKSKIITIDNASTLDIDDALSLTMDEAGNYILEVHIANVGRVLLANQFLIAEILKRGTSIYFGNDYIVHMLPEIISTNHCSLIAGEPRGVITNRFKINRAGIVEHYSCFENTIVVSKKFTYKQVDHVLNERLFDEAYSPMLRSLYELTRLMQSRYKKNIDLYEQVRDSSIFYDSQKIIEEMSVLTNWQIASLALTEQDKYPFIHRKHDDGERAVYTKESDFHFGLNLESYTHFTAPIRRISDAILQMILIDLKFNDTPIYKDFEEWGLFIDEHLSHINERMLTAKQHTKRYHISSQYINGKR